MVNRWRVSVYNSGAPAPQRVWTFIGSSAMADAQRQAGLLAEQAKKQGFGGIRIAVEQAKDDGR